jgi:toxin ParE1/3/4
MAFQVLIAEDAERDIADIHAYLAESDSAEKADRLVDELEGLCAKLAELPERGNVPPELRALGITEYREVHYKPYRVIYRVLGRRVIVTCVLDGRRDMQSLLERRLIR